MPRPFLSLPLYLLAFAAGSAHATDWRYFIGIHDIIVDDVDSQTYGIAAGVAGEKRTASGRRVFGELDLFWDRDKDHLDPDHIPIWWQAHIGTDGELWKLSPQFRVDWTADIDTRANTVSSVERQIEVLPALVARYDGASAHASLKAGIGYWFLEIDDDAPKEFGYYEKDQFRNTTIAESLGAAAAIDLGRSFKLVGRAKAWWDRDEWLYTQYAGEAHLALDHENGRSEIVLDVEANDYDFDRYNQPGLPSILSWDDDVLIRLFFITAW